MSDAYTKLKICDFFDTFCMMGDSSKELDVATTTPVGEADHATPSTLYFSALKEQIERSKVHWSTLVNCSSYTNEEEVDFEMSNNQEFKALQRHPIWSSFFVKFSSDGKSTSSDDILGELTMGEKFAEGGQAELYEAHIKWIDPKYVEIERRLKVEYVLKVLKEGTLLKHVKSQLPQGLVPYHFELLENLMSPTPKVFPLYVSQVHYGTLLKGGRFAFLIRKQDFDLLTLIERNMRLKSGENCGPFSKEDAQILMYDVALGVNCLHNQDILHRDLKASNVLVCESENTWPKWISFVADYECSIGVVGTNFFRAPEVLQACKEQKVNERPEVFSRGSDVYSYGMTCYEILTGRLPFHDHPLRDNSPLLIDLVINQHLRPEVPTYIDEWTRELLDGCWEFDPTSRPGIGEILDILSTNSAEVRRFEVGLKKKFGENFRS